MARASYKAGIEWIALNDEPTETERDVVAGQISVALLADLFEKETDDVAKAVLRYRRKRPDER